MFNDAHPCKSNKNSEYDLEIPQSQTANNPMAQRERATWPSRDTRKKPITFAILYFLYYVRWVNTLASPCRLICAFTNRICKQLYHLIIYKILCFRRLGPCDIIKLCLTHHKIDNFVQFSSCYSQRLFIHVRTGLLWLNQH